MKLREFNKTLNACRVKGRLNLARLTDIPNETKTEMVQFIVRNRGPVMMDLIPPGFDWPWLQCCGYLHITKGAQSGFTFAHTAEHNIK